MTRLEILSQFFFDVVANSVYQCENMESDWENVTEIPEPRVHHAAAALGNLLFVIGKINYVSG